MRIFRPAERVGSHSTVRKLFEQKPVFILHWTSTGFFIEVPGVSSNFINRSLGLQLDVQEAPQHHQDEYDAQVGGGDQLRDKHCRQGHPLHMTARAILSMDNVRHKLSVGKTFQYRADKHVSESNPQHRPAQLEQDAQQDSASDPCSDQEGYQEHQLAGRQENRAQDDLPGQTDDKDQSANGV